MAGLTDVFNRLSLSLALWNGVDPILKERMFGLSGPEGNHGEDVKDYWWYLDALPSSSWLRWRYHYPQAPFPYEDLVRTNATRNQARARVRLHRYRRVRRRPLLDRRGPLREGITDRCADADHCPQPRAGDGDAARAADAVVPQRVELEPGGGKPGLITTGGTRIEASHAYSGSTSSTSGRTPTARGPSCCSARTRPISSGVDGTPNTTPYPKDGINDHVIAGADTVNTAGTGTKAAAWYRLTVPAGGTAEVRLRLHRHDEAAPSGNGATAPDRLGAAFETTMRRREAEADEFYAELRRDDATDDEAMIMRQAFAGMLWSKQYYGYSVSRWLDGVPGLPPPPPERKTGRNADWRHFDAADIMSMPDPWEYPWFAAWDLAFHAVTLAHIDPAFAKYQLLLLCREWFQHPNGALPAYEWAFDDINPPVHAAAAYLVFAIDRRRDFQFLRRVFHKLLFNFTWWLNREDKEGNDLFSGGFLGLDNIGAFDRSHLPSGTELEQSDATAGMFQYCINMLRIATVLSEDDPTYEDFQTTFMEHAVVSPRR